jgi:hypothetical protein
MNYGLFIDFIIVIVIIILVSRFFLEHARSEGKEMVRGGEWGLHGWSLEYLYHSILDEWGFD